MHMNLQGTAGPEHRTFGVSVSGEPRPELALGYPRRLHHEYHVAESGKGAFILLLRTSTPN